MYSLGIGLANIGQRASSTSEQPQQKPRRQTDTPAAPALTTRSTESRSSKSKRKGDEGLMRPCAVEGFLVVVSVLAVDSLPTKRQITPGSLRIDQVAGHECWLLEAEGVKHL
jgi:hypothetical protein